MTMCGRNATNGDSLCRCSSLVTSKRIGLTTPNVVEIATSDAPRPRPVTKRPMRGWLRRASGAYERPSRKAANLALELRGAVLGLEEVPSSSNAARNRHVQRGLQGGKALPQARCRSLRRRIQRGRRRPGWISLRASMSAEGSVSLRDAPTLWRFGPNACFPPILYLSKMEPCSPRCQNRKLLSLGGIVTN